eukprot:6178937-Pleurochrysis_carterae.AAC.1
MNLLYFFTAWLLPSCWRSAYLRATPQRPAEVVANCERHDDTTEFHALRVPWAAVRQARASRAVPIESVVIYWEEARSAALCNAS